MIGLDPSTLSLLGWFLIVGPSELVFPPQLNNFQQWHCLPCCRVNMTVASHLSKWICSFKSLWGLLIGTSSTASQNLIQLLTTSFMKLALSLSPLYNTYFFLSLFSVDHLPAPSPKNMNYQNSEPQPFTLFPLSSH